MMTRNDFELLANALKSERVRLDLGNIPANVRASRIYGFQKAVNCVAEVCKASNARFQKAKFFAACDIDSPQEAGEAPFNDRKLGNFDGIKQAD